LGIGIRKVVKGMEKMESRSVYIICGIRIFQRERGLLGMMNTMKFKLLEGYWGETLYYGDDSDLIPEE
jgi:hypothetical protein